MTESSFTDRLNAIYGKIVRVLHSSDVPRTIQMILCVWKLLYCSPEFGTVLRNPNQLYLINLETLQKLSTLLPLWKQVSLSKHRWQCYFVGLKSLYTKHVYDLIVSFVYKIINSVIAVYNNNIKLVTKYPLAIIEQNLILLYLSQEIIISIIIRCATYKYQSV